MSAQDSIPEVFDVFLCHNSEDKPAVREIAKRLAKQGIKPWLDEEQIRPGTSWQVALGEQIESIKSAAVFVGESGIGPWQKEEIQGFLNEFIDRKCPVIPTILSSVSTIPKLPFTLKNRHRVDFRVPEPDPIKQLIWGITGKKPTPRESLIPDKNESSEPRRRYLESRLYPPLAETPNQENRAQLEILRRRVMEYWVDGVLRHSLYKEVLLSLGKRQVDEFVDAPWKYTIELSDAVSSVLLPDRNVTTIYDSTGLLLVLGEPGSGKSTTLLDLARTLLERARVDIRERVAIVLNLSSWKKKQPLAEWISAELFEKYRVSKKIARLWLKHDYLVPLLDGLDEVETSTQPDCSAAINTFIEESNPSGLVVCCRLNEYRWLPDRLRLNGAIRLEPLSEDEVDEYLKRSGPELATLREAVNTDPVLKELTETPLMLNIMSIAFQGASLSELVSRKGSLPEERRRQIFDLYVERMFQRKGTASLVFAKEKTIGWLSWLAERMREHSQSVFLVEGLQPSWLCANTKRLAYGPIVVLGLGLLFGLIEALTLGLGFGLIGGLIVFVAVGLGCWSESALKNGVMAGLTGGLMSGLIVGIPLILIGTQSGTQRELSKQMTSGMGTLGEGTGMLIGLFAGIICGLVGGLIFGLMGGLGTGSLNHITLVEAVTWMWNQFWRKGILGLIVGLIVGLVVAFIAFVSGRLTNEPNLFISGVLGFGLAFGLASGLIGGFADRVQAEKASPNEGIKLSLKNSLAAFLVTWWIVLLVLALIFGSPRWPTALTVGLTFGLIVGLNRGGSAVIKHYSLRLILWLTGRTTFNFVKFLNQCATLILLKKVGGGYIFIHRMLLEYFAEMSPRSKKG